MDAFLLDTGIALDLASHRSAHRSIYDGAVLSGAGRRRFRHDGLAHLERILKATASVPRRRVAVDDVYSMEGDAGWPPAPGVPLGTERLRCFVTASHCEADLEYAAEAIGEVLGRG